MIQNVLQPNELKRFIQPFLQLMDPDAAIGIFSEIIGHQINKREDIVCQTKIQLLYKGYQIDIRDLRVLEDTALAVSMQFKAKQKWYHNLFKDQNKEIVQDLQSICKSELPEISFRHFTTKGGNPILGNEQFELTFIHDSRAFNETWENGRDISPLVIAPDSHDGNCFVEFQFNPSCYFRDDGKTQLRTDWQKNASLVSDEIERSARRMLGKDQG